MAWRKGRSQILVVGNIMNIVFLGIYRTAVIAVIVTFDTSSDILREFNYYSCTGVIKLFLG